MRAGVCLWASTADRRLWGEAVNMAERACVCARWRGGPLPCREDMSRGERLLAVLGMGKVGRRRKDVWRVGGVARELRVACAAWGSPYARFPWRVLRLLRANR